MNYTTQMYLDCDPLIATGREIWGFTKKYADPIVQVVKVQVVQDTLTGTFCYAGERVTLGTMAFKHESLWGQGFILRLSLKSS